MKWFEEMPERLMMTILWIAIYHLIGFELTVVVLLTILVIEPS